MSRYPKKLIEVALPLDDINIACAKEKSIRQGHPSTLHLWWARRPLAAARAVIFAQMVNDPCAKWEGSGRENESQIKATCASQRNRLFDIIRRLVLWENTNNESVLNEAREEIKKSWRETCELSENRGQKGFDPDVVPAFHDPFAGGGAIPLEAQRLGLESHATDLNPVAVIINKAMIEIPPKFAGRAPVCPMPQNETQTRMPQKWHSATGLAEDVRRYGAWMRDEAEKRIGLLYPKIEVTAEMSNSRPDLIPHVGKSLTVIAWLWARTVKSPNPAYSHVEVPLASSFMLSTKEGKEAYVEPVIVDDGYHFTVKVGEPIDVARVMLGTTAGKRHAFRCLMSDVPVSYDYIRQEGKAGRMGARLMAIVADSDRGRIYLAPTPQMETIALQAQPTWRPDNVLPENPRDFKTPNYGLTTFANLFTNRQLVALTTFSDLISEAHERVKNDAISAGAPDDAMRLDSGGTGSTAYADAVCVYLACALEKTTDYNSTVCTWISGGQTMRNTFGRQAIPMVWDYAEANIISHTTGSFSSSTDQVVRVINDLPASAMGYATQRDAQTQETSIDKVVSTDPPYYDNIGYADLSDFFYIWLRRALRPIFPDLFSTLAVPKSEELVATPYRHGGKEQAEAFFLNGMTQAMHRLAEESHPAFPVTIYYAFKQSESEGHDGTASTGWETFLDAVIQAGFALTGTWPMRTEMGNRMLGSGTNALASSIVLVCRRRAPDSTTISRRDFLRELRDQMPAHLEDMIGGTEQASPVKPVDLAQAAIGPGMGIYSKYTAVLEADGTPMAVRTALAEINKEIDRYFGEVDSDLDASTRFCLSWFQQFRWSPGPFGDAETLATAKATSVAGLATDGIIVSGSGKVRLLRATELSEDWNPDDDARLSVWRATHQLIHALEKGAGSAGQVLATIPDDKLSKIRQLAYRLQLLCDKNGLAQDALSYGGLIDGWNDIQAKATELKRPGREQAALSL